MCKGDKSVTIEPLTWNEDCAKGTCKQCPGLTLSLETNVENIMVYYHQWEYKKQTVTNNK